MSVLFADIIAGAKSLADYDGAGAGSTLGLDDTRWSIWGNQSIESLYKKFLIWNPDLFESTATPDYVLAAEEGQIAPPADYRSFRGLTKSPDTFCPREVRKFNYGARDDQCDVHYREAGKIIRLEPKHRSNGTYRLTYTAGPVNLSNGDAPIASQTANLTAKAMLDNSLLAASGTVVPLTGDTFLLEAANPPINLNAGGVLSGSWTAAGAGPGKTLTATANGAIAPLDGIAIGTGNFVLVLGGTGVAAQDFGVYLITAGGSGGSPAVLLRIPGQDTSAVYVFGYTVHVAAGTTNGNAAFVLSTVGAVLDTTPLAFVKTGAPQLTIDSVVCVSGDTVFVNTNGEHSYDGVYTLSYSASNGFWLFTRVAGDTIGINHPAGFTVGVTTGNVNGNKIYSADANIIWGLSVSTWSKVQAAIDPLYEPGREWLEVRTAMRALGKGEESTGELGARLAELTAELQVYVQSLDSGDGDTAVDVERDDRPGIYRLLGH